MRFNSHTKVEGSHAFLSASSYHWVNYDEEKLRMRLRTSLEAARGTRLHDFAKEAILLKQRMPRNNQTLNRYINDAIAFDMTPEQVLFYSMNAYGTADAIRFDQDTLRLMIHDLKTGKTKVSMTQLEVYTAYFCLEYGFKPSTLDIKLRIYQNDEVWEHVPDLEDVVYIMDKIVTSDRIIEEEKELYY